MTHPTCGRRERRGQSLRGTKNVFSWACSCTTRPLACTLITRASNLISRRSGSLVSQPTSDSGRAGGNVHHEPSISFAKHEAARGDDASDMCCVETLLLPCKGELKGAIFGEAAADNFGDAAVPNGFSFAFPFHAADILVEQKQ